VHSKQLINPEVLNALAHIVKHVLSIATLINSTDRDPSDPSRSLIISPVPQPMSLHCITCTLCKMLYIGETGRRLGDRFREHLERRRRKTTKTHLNREIARHFSLPNHNKQHIAVCGLSLHQGSTESRKTLEQKFQYLPLQHLHKTFGQF